MSISASSAQIDAALVYERLFVPAEFQEWATHMIDAADIRPAERVLDVACGTGVLARTAAAQVGPAGLIAGVDIDVGMIAVAAQLAPDIEFRQGAAESLPYQDETFDAVLSQFGLMFFKDRVDALREMRRVAKHGGRIVVAVWDTLENTPAYDILVHILENVAGSAAAAPLRAPFALGDRAALATLCAQAGLEDATITTRVGVSKFPNIRTLVEADLRGWLPLMGVVLPEQQIENIIEGAEHALASYVTIDGQVHFNSPAHVVTAVKRARA